MSDRQVQTPALEVRGVSKTFDGHIRAVDDVTLTIEHGEFVAMSGPSGCGKSTLLHLVAALDKPTSGTILVDGRPLSERHLDAYRRSEVGIVFQLHNLLPHLTARQNVEIAMMGSGLGRRDQQLRATRLLDEVGLLDRERSRPPQLSGGERQLVALARALANRPTLLLADEPTGSLDSTSVDRVLGLLHELRDQHGVTLLMVTHDPVVAARADRIVHMRDGRIESSDARQTLLEGG